MQTLIYVCGIVLAVGAVRAWHVPPEETSTSLLRAAREIDWRGSIPTLQHTAEWLHANRKVAMMILVGSIVVALYDGLNTLLPVYVRDVLKTDPTNAVYILAPGAIGFVVGTALGPWWMNRRGERALGVMALMVLSLGYILFGFIDLVAPIMAPFSPLRLFELFGATISPQIKAAGLISILTSLGSTGAGAAVQTYVNRYVLISRQATTFGMEEVTDNALTLLAILILGALATVVGSRLVFILAPPIVVALVIWLVHICFRVTTNDPPNARIILDELIGTSQQNASGQAPEVQ
jgi:MFS family permease